MPQEVLRWRLSLFAFTFVVGVGMASWVTRTPAIRDAVHASTAGMGLILLGVSVGSMAGVLSSEHLVRRWGTRSVIILGGWFVVIGAAALGMTSTAGVPAGVFLGYILFGFGSGVGEVALNIDGADVERRLGRPVLPALHGCFSLGALVGAVLGIVLTAAGVPVVWHLTGCAAVLAAVILWARRSLPAGTVQASGSDGGQTDRAQRTRSVWRDPALLLLGVILLALGLAEGSANDWLPLIVVDGLDLSQVWSSAVFAAFAAVMTIGRFCGHLIIDRIGKEGTLLASIISAGTGITLVALIDQQSIVLTGVALWGLGASLGFPVALSLAGDNRDRPAERVAAVATAGYVAFLVGPPALGFLGQRYGIRTAILVVVALLFIAAVTSLTRTRVIIRQSESAPR